MRKTNLLVTTFALFTFGCGAEISTTISEEPAPIAVVTPEEPQPITASTTYTLKRERIPENTAFAACGISPVYRRPKKDKTSADYTMYLLTDSKNFKHPTQVKGKWTRRVINIKNGADENSYLAKPKDVNSPEMEILKSGKTALWDFSDELNFPDLYAKFKKNDTGRLYLAAAEWYRAFVEINGKKRQVIFLDLNGDKKLGSLEKMYIGAPTETDAPPRLYRRSDFSKVCKVLNIDDKLYALEVDLAAQKVAFRPLDVKMGQIKIEHPFTAATTGMTVELKTLDRKSIYKTKFDLNSTDNNIPAGNYSGIKMLLKTKRKNRFIEMVLKDIEVKPGQINTITITRPTPNITMRQRNGKLSFYLKLFATGSLESIECFASLKDAKAFRKEDNKIVRNYLRANLTLASAKEPEKILHTATIEDS